MTTFSIVYQEPGTYVKIQDVALPAIPPGTVVIALVGYGKLDKLIVQEEVTRATADVDGMDELVYSNENAISVTSQIQDKLGNIYTEGVDYVLNTSVGVPADPANLDWALTGAGTSEPDAGIKYYVNYNVSKLESEDDFEPKFVFDEDEGISLYGNSMEANTNSDDQTLPAAINLAFENNASQLVAVQINHDDTDPVNDAIAKLELENVQVVVPCIGVSTTENSTVPTTLSAHVNNMSSLLERKFRIGLLGVHIDVDVKNDFATTKTEYAALAALNNNRIGVVGPSKSYITTAAGTTAVGAWSLAAAIAGILGNDAFDAGEPISGKLLAGLVNIDDVYRRVQKNQLAGLGISLIEKVGITFSVRHFLSTDMTTPVSQELKVTLIADYIATIMIAGLTGIFVNTRNIGSETIANMKATVRLILEGQVPNILTGFRKISVKQNAIEPRQHDIKFEISGVADNNWILVTMGVTI